ncbi:MAG: type II CAAX endopeptidase family protein [Mucinivorans sp.]
MKRIILIVVSFLLIFLFANLIVGGALDAFVDTASMGAGLDILVGYVASMGLVIALLWAAKPALNLSFVTFAPRIGKVNPSLMLLGLLLILISGMAADPIIKLLPSSSLDALYQMLGTGMWAIVTGVVAAPLMEEYIFRGMLQRSLTVHSSPILGVIFSAVIFGLIHVIPQQIVGAMMAGLVLGAIFYLTGSLTTVVVIHLLNNGLAYLQLLYLGADFDLMTTLFPERGHYIVAVVVAWVVVVLFWVIGMRKIQKK